MSTGVTEEFIPEANEAAADAPEKKALNPKPWSEYGLVLDSDEMSLVIDSVSDSIEVDFIKNALVGSKILQVGHSRSLRNVGTRIRWFTVTSQARLRAVMNRELDGVPMIIFNVLDRNDQKHRLGLKRLDILAKEKAESR